MGFVGVYKALYDYAPQSEGELAITEGSLLYVLDKDGGDGWWKAKKKAAGDDEDEPEGLIPENYVEEAQPTRHARALYEYTRQTDEELSFPEDAQLAIYDTSDPDWILAGYDNDYGFAPANYIDMDGTSAAAADANDGEADDEGPPPVLPSRQATINDDDNTPSPRLPPRGAPSNEPSSPNANSAAAAALANVLSGRSAAQRPATPPPSLPDRPRYLSDDASEGEDPLSPPLPTRPRPQATFDDDEPSPSLPQRSKSNAYGGNRAGDSSRSGGYDDEESHAPNALSPGGFHLYNISEMVSVMGKRKKMPTTLGINLKTGVILIAPERSQDGPSQEWSGDKMTHYSREGKHVFMELVKPSKSVDFHAGAKDTAEEIVSALGELAGAVRAEGLREVILAGTGHELKKAVVLYDFMAQGDDEVTVATGDEVIVLDDRRSEEWCQVRRVKNGKEGVVPLSYVEVTGSITSDIPPQPISGHQSPTPSSPTTNTAPAISTSMATIGARSTVKQNRLDEERLTRDAVRAAVRDESKRANEVGHGVHPPERRSSLYATNVNGGDQQGQRKKENGNGSSSRSGKAKPDASKVRTWTDRTKSFSVDAQFLGLKDGKINLHKMNGVKIAVPVAKMSLEDLEYVEAVTGVSLDEDKPLSSMKRRSQIQQQHESQNSSGTKVGASIEPKKSDYDWFQFFLTCEVAVGLCERYAQAFVKDNMDESVLPDINASNLRTLGLREGDIIKVMRFLDNKYGRSKKGGDDGADGGGLFSGPGGTLRNNTRRGRPTPTTQANDVVDAKAFSQQKSSDASNATNGNRVASPVEQTPAERTAPPPKQASASSGGGFDDDAWDVKPSRQPAPAATPEPPTAQHAPEAAPPPPVAKPTAALTGSMQELSLLSQALPAEKLNPNPPPPITLPAQATPAVSLPPVQQQPPPQMPGASPAMFAGLAQQQTGIQGMNGLQPQQTAASFARARPMAPQYTQGQGGLLPPPPSRPLSAPQSAQPSAFSPPPLQPHMTGMVTGQVAPAGQSLNDINQARMQQQYQQQMQQMMAQQQPQGMMPMMTGMPAQQQPQPTGFGMPGQQFMPQQQNQFGQPVQMQPTGFGGPFNPGQQQFGMAPPQGGNINSMLPPALEPQRTAMPVPPAQQQQQTMQPMQPQPTGPFTQGFGNHGMAPTPAPLLPQQTGPPPPVRFGVTEETKKLMPQATGRRANLLAATPDNPFGF
ncbi:hypothetical protein HMPREF1624_07157 [Sporothrix schenckii ATCC 58251]|uniref:Actin cytoskeleton-regulatory complex protein SLA1 n=1 Tax=Sporothrix schenckii (strain ATCC 58251 / de Perez 2211183) TaxID=1391915 RepID=U7PKR9_SPOS1|nr:hypothetical protein HMPREF1624_07157 [Sporothrix schenckii ATCC 58251]